MQKLIALVAIAACLGVALSTTCTDLTNAQRTNCQANGCSDGTANGYCLACSSGYQSQKTGSPATYSCVQIAAADASCKNGWYPPASMSGTTPTPAKMTCAVASPAVAAATATVADIATAPTKATALTECTGLNGAKDKTNYTASQWATSGAAYTATPTNTFQCLACPTGCENCDSNSTDADQTKSLPAAGSTITTCAKATSGYALGPLGANGMGIMCPSDITKYGSTVNATTCTACATATNCTAATCGTGYTYLSYASLAGITNVGGVNLSALTGVPVPLQGCYNVTAMKDAYGAKSASTISVAFAAVAAVVAAVFAF